jgi:MFS transporter, FHS family, L-fucose permease
VGPFVSLAKDQFQLSNTVASLIPLVGFSMFGLLSVAVGIFQDKRGKKFVLMMGLVVSLVGLLNAAFGLSSFPQFLITVLMMGAGAAILQVAGNPIMRDVSDAGKFARNLTLGQFVKAIGSLSGSLIPVAARYFFDLSWTVIFPIYAVVLLIATLLVSTVQVKREKPDGKSATFGSCLALLSNSYVLAMVIAIFLYVGAEVSMSANIPLFLKERYQIDVTKVGLLGTSLFFLALTVGRFCGGLALSWMKPRKFFVVTCVASILGLLGLFVPVREVAAASFVLIGLGFANIFPLVFSLAVEHMPERTNEISGLMVTAIVGGAILPPLMGVVADHSTVQLSFLVPIAAIAYIGCVALANLKEKAAAA